MPLVLWIWVGGSTPKWEAPGMTSALPLALKEALAAPPCFIGEETEAEKPWEEPSSPVCHPVSVYSCLEQLQLF